MGLQVSPLGVIPQACETVQGYSDTLLSPLKWAGDILHYFGISFNQPTDAFYQHVKDQKNFLGLPLSLSYFLNFKNNVAILAEGTSQPIYYASKSLSDGFDTVNAACDFTQFLSDKHVVSLNDVQSEMLGTVSSGTLLGSGVMGVGIHGHDMVKASERSYAAFMPDEKQVENVRFNHSLILLAKNVTYVALGALALSAYVLGAVFAPWIGLAVATSTLFLTLTSYFYDHLNGYQPPPVIR